MRGPAEAMPADPWPGRQTAEPARSHPQQLSCSCQVSTILLLQGGSALCLAAPSTPLLGGCASPRRIPIAPNGAMLGASPAPRCRIWPHGGAGMFDSPVTTPQPFNSAPEACLCPSGCPRAGTTQPCATGVSMSPGRLGVGRAGSVPSTPRLCLSLPHQGIYRKGKLPFPKGASQSTTLCSGKQPPASPKLIPSAAFGIAQGSGHLASPPGTHPGAWGHPQLRPHKHDSVPTRKGKPQKYRIGNQSKQSSVKWSISGLSQPCSLCCSRFLVS